MVVVVESPMKYVWSMNQQMNIVLMRNYMEILFERYYLQKHIVLIIIAGWGAGEFP
jgi:hypothetical protein